MRDFGELSIVTREEAAEFWARALLKAVTVVWPLTGKDLDAAAGFVPLSKPQPGEQPKPVFPRQAMRNDWGGFTEK